MANKFDSQSRSAAEQALVRQTRDLGERIKEISCLHDITLLLTNREWSVERMLDACVRRMPDGWLEPQHTCARIRFGDQMFATPNFSETKWKLEAAIPFVTKGSGYVEVFYMEETAGKKPFLDEEQDSINSIARMVAQALERRWADEELVLQRDNFMRILNAMTDGIYVVNRDYDIEYVNPVIEREFGEVVGRKCYTYFHDRNESCPWCKNEQVFNGKTVRWEWYSSKTGKTYDLLDTPIKKPDGTISKFEIFHDITERKHLEDDLRQREEKYSQLFNNMVQGVFYQQANGEFIDVNAAALSMFGMTRDEFLGKTSLSYDWKALDEHGFDLPGHDHPSMIALSTGKVVLNKVVGVFNHLKNDYAWVSVNAIPQFRPGDKKPYQAFVTLHDITELKRAEEQIRVMAFYDALTQLPNRRLLNDRLELAMAASKRSGRYAALMFFDLDNFKPLNDLYGHDVGDLLLIEVARRADGCMREVDTVARFGGDEFVVMLSELDQDKSESIKQAGIVAEKLRSRLAEPYRLTFRQGGAAEISVEHHSAVSIGVALFIDHEASLEEILKWADIAMYQAKQGGRNRVHFHASSG